MRRRLISVDEAARGLGVSTHFVRKWVRLGRLPFHRVGSRILLDETDLERFVEAGRVEAHARSQAVSVAMSASRR